MSENKIPENLKKLKTILNNLDDEDRKFVEGHIVSKNNTIRNLNESNKTLLNMISEMWEIMKNLHSNTNTSMKSILRIISPLLENKEE